MLPIKSAEIRAELSKTAIPVFEKGTTQIRSLLCNQFTTEGRRLQIFLLELCRCHFLAKISHGRVVIEPVKLLCHRSYHLDISNIRYHQIFELSAIKVNQGKH